MRERCVISAGQLFGLLLAGRLILMVTTNSVWSGGGDFLDNVIACALACAITFIAVIPLWLLHRRHPTLSVLEQGDSFAKGVGAAVGLFYGIYFLVMDCYYLSVFEVFNANMVNPELPSWMIVFAILIVAVYAVWKGVESLARAAVLILVIVLLGLGIILATTAPSINGYYFKPVFYNGWEQTLQSTILFLGRGTGIATLAVLLPRAKGRRKIGFALWNVLAYLFMGVILTVMVGVLGNAVQTQMFPMHTLAAIAGIGPFQRMDSLFLWIWLMGTFLKIAIDLYLFTVCMKQVFGVKQGIYFTIGGAVFVGVAAVVIIGSVEIQRVFFNVYLLAPLTLGAAIGIPLILLVADLIRGRTQQKNQQKLEVRHESGALD